LFLLEKKNRCAPLAVVKDKALGVQLLLQRYKMFQKGETKGQNLLRGVERNRISYKVMEKCGCKIFRERNTFK
jgi:hypothetical protein